MYASLLSFPLFFGLLCVATNFYIRYSLLLVAETQAFNVLQKFLEVFWFSNGFLFLQVKFQHISAKASHGLRTASYLLSVSHSVPQL